MSRFNHLSCNAYQLFFICIITASLSSPGAAAAEPDGTPPQQAQGRISMTTAPVYQFDTPMHNGSVSVFRQHTNIKYNKPLSSTLEAGIRLTYDFADYRFSGPTTLAGGMKPWGKIHTIDLEGNLGYDLTPEWTIMVSSSVYLAREENAGLSNAIGYGGFTAVTKDFGPKVTLGIGVGAYSNLEKITVFPAGIIKWQITDRLLLSNPLRPGPNGPAGAELSYKIGDSWETGIGAAYRHNRFRLNSSGFTKDGIGETTSLPTWLRLSRKFADAFHLDLYSGVLFGGTISIDNSRGSTLSSDHLQPAPFVSFALSARF